MSVTTSSALTTETGSISFSKLSENCVFLPCKIKRCDSTCVYSEENGNKLYLVSIPTRMQLNKTRCSGFRAFFSILSKTNSKMICVIVF